MPLILSTTTPDYSYDFPMPSTSPLINPSLPTRKPSHVLRRPRSSSPTYLPTTHSSKYLPSTRAAEVSRLLDPAYANPQHSQGGSGSTSSNSPLSVFVDHYGDLHDPEYRHFPVVATRPKWEHGEDDLIDEEDEDVFGPTYFHPSSRKPTFNSTTTSYRPSYTYASYHYDVPNPSPSSYESNVLVNEDIEESPFADEVSEKKVVKSTARRRRHRHSKSGQAVEEKESLAAAENAEISTAPGADYVPGEFGDHDWTPTCTQSLRREWQAITLRLRFSLFHMKRNMKRRLGTG